jgi:hypothetical protein
MSQSARLATEIDNLDAFDVFFISSNHELCCDIRSGRKKGIHPNDSAQNDPK